MDRMKNKTQVIDKENPKKTKVSAYNLNNRPAMRPFSAPFAAPYEAKIIAGFTVLPGSYKTSYNTGKCHLTRKKGLDTRPAF